MIKCSHFKIYQKVTDFYEPSGWNIISREEGRLTELQISVIWEQKQLILIQEVLLYVM